MKVFKSAWSGFCLSWLSWEYRLFWCCEFQYYVWWILAEFCPWPLQSEGLREETFTTIERQYMVGLRASDPVVRAKFFSLYNAAVPHSLYDRLKFILEEQDWTRVSHTFWIKHGLVRPSSL